MSTKNPFRQPSPSAQPPSPPLPPLPSQDLPSSSSTTTTTASSPPSTSLHSTLHPPTMDNLEDDLPPPYTPTAKAGEETVGLGPRRPFQQAPPAPSSSLHPSPSQRSNRSSPFAQSYYQSPSPGFYTQPDSRGMAPWQFQQQYRQRQRVGGGLIGALIDTVRDIADVVSGVHDERLMASQSANAGAYASPYTNTRTAYAPPSGPPGQVQQSPPPRPVSAPPNSPPPVSDDGSPTRTPVPGHPLLLDGNLLVYPRDHLCVKCKNTGFKNYDPSNPCRKCWDKYGKPYTGALTYTPWSPSGNDPRMQRPLPKFVPPHLSGLNGASSSSCEPPPQHPLRNGHSRSVSQPHYPSGSYYVLNPLSPTDAPPVPNAIPVEPGDPRLGGRLCMRCRGTGTRTVMLIDVMMCDQCGGTGRVWM